VNIVAEIGQNNKVKLAKLMQELPLPPLFQRGGGNKKFPSLGTREGARMGGRVLQI
jgi:hypothetical protein